MRRMRKETNTSSLDCLSHYPSSLYCLSVLTTTIYSPYACRQQISTIKKPAVRKVMKTCPQPSPSPSPNIHKQKTKGQCPAIGRTATASLSMVTLPMGFSLPPRPTSSKQPTQLSHHLWPSRPDARSRGPMSATPLGGHQTT